MTIRFLRITTAVLVFVLLAAVPTWAATAKEIYVAAMAREEAVRSALARPAPPAGTLAEGRAVIAAYLSIVRQYPRSGYSDDALWQAAELSLTCFRSFGEDRDRAAGVKLLKRLPVEYPTSKFARRVPERLASLESDRTERPRKDVPAMASMPTAPVPGRSSGAAPGQLARVTRVARTVLPEVVRVTIELDREVAFRDQRIDGPARILLDLSGTTTSAALRDRTLRFDGDSDLVRQIRVGRQADHMARVVLDATGVASYSVSALYNPFRLVIDCARPPNPGRSAPGVVAATAPGRLIPPKPRPPIPSRRVGGVWSLVAVSAPVLPAPAVRVPAAPPVARSSAGNAPAGHATASADEASKVAPAPAPVTSAAPPAPPSGAESPPAAPLQPSAPGQPLLPPGGFTMARQLGLGVSRIVIDPGHGGHDPGASGKGITEAELVLDVALRVEKLLQKVRGTEVILTRRTDEFIPLPERTAIANREGADLFLSIHANASPTPEARGVETYFLNFANNQSAAAVAARENAASGQGMAALPDLVKAIALNNKVDESRDFAGEVQKALAERLRATNKTLRDLGVKQAPFVVLIGASMPSVLAEISFVTNPQEARLLRSPAYRQRIAEALYTAIRRYQSSLSAATTVAHQ